MAVKVEQLIQPVKAMGRKWRMPKHPFALVHKPYQLQPFLIAPVLPGDTLSHGLMQARAVTQPINNALTGWWQEYYFFYVRLQDLNIRDSIPDMFMDEAFDPSSLHEAAAPVYYHAGGGINWIKHALQRITEEYFRDEGEDWLAGSLDGLPMAKAFGRGDAWTDSLIEDAEAPETVQDDPDMEVYGEAYAKWQHMAQLKLTNLTFPEYLERAYGVDQPTAKAEAHRPELIRYIRSWSYPTNTVDPTTGTPSSAVVWSVRERIDKARYCAEPGFIVGVTVTRPKVFMGNQKGTASILLNKGERWLPTTVLQQDGPHASLVQVPTGAGPIPSLDDVGGYWLDIADLLMYGEQYLNFATTATGKNIVSLPDAAGNSAYPTSANIEALFKSSAATTITQDGIVDLRFKSRVTDTTK